MTTAEFIDVVLTPAAAGIAGAIGMRFSLRRQSEDAYSPAASRWIPVGVGAAVFVIMFTTKLLGVV